MSRTRTLLSAAIGFAGAAFALNAWAAAAQPSSLPQCQPADDAKGTTAAAPADAARPGAHTLVVNGVQLWYCVAGRGASALPPVVFVHGGPGYNSHSFAALAGPRLEHLLRMVYVDQRGAGQSERPADRDYAMATLVQDLDALRQALGVERMSLIGHSFGGTLALEYAAAHPTRVARLVLVSAASDLPAACHARVSWLAKLYPAELRRARDAKARDARDCELAFGTLQGDAARAFNDRVMFPNDRLRELQDDIDERSGLHNTGELQRALIEAGLLSYRFAHADRLTMPVLVLAGGEDGAIGLPQQRAIARAVAHGRLKVYARAGHFLYLDEPQRFTRDVVDFLDDTAR